MNRLDKTVTSEFTIDKPDGSEFVFEKEVFTEINKGKQTQFDHFIYDDMGTKSWKIEMFKIEIERILKAI